MRPLTREEIGHSINKPIGPNTSIVLHFIKAYCVVLASQRNNLREIYNHNVKLCDGTPLFLFLRLFDRKFDLFRGADFMRDVLSDASLSKNHFFIGGTTQSQKDLEAVLLKGNPDLRIVGSISPPYLDNFDLLIDDWVRILKKSQPDFVWIGIGTPKQDYLAAALSDKFSAVYLTVGAAFDFLSGNKNESPQWLRGSGLEWLYRWLQEPRRLSSRYVVGNVKFMSLILQTLLHRTFK